MDLINIKGRAADGTGAKRGREGEKREVWGD